MVKIVSFILVFSCVELYFIILLGQKLGAMTTSVLIVLTGTIGFFFTKQNGKIILKKMIGTTKRNKVPTREVIEGILMVVGGLLLLIPGIMTDLMGLLLVLNYSRKIVLSSYGQQIQNSKFFKQLRDKLREDMKKRGLLQ